MQADNGGPRDTSAEVPRPVKFPAYSSGRAQLRGAGAADSRAFIFTRLSRKGPARRVLQVLAARRFFDDQRLRGHAHDPQAAMAHARIRNGGRSALCEPVVPLRRLIRQLGRGKLRLRLANAAETSGAAPLSPVSAAIRAACGEFMEAVRKTPSHGRETTASSLSGLTDDSDIR